MKKIAKRIKRYKELKADIVDIDLKLQELEEDMLGITAQPSDERTGKTYKITSSVEIQAEKHLEKKEILLRQRATKTREIARIDNALTVLKEEERDIIETALIEQKRYSLLEIKYNRTYSRIKQIEGEAVKKMEKYLA
ncbi:hypothetical protein [Clostridium celatum]|uniref:hypothetical protein n=1 Tax=Clostridium celatum TaxID=36834 RepID=UPI0029106EC3|nr:hypothetical protein [Clostridium celatum]MDU6296829.1 hypothetical protein [Clostridium celatum]